MKPLSKNDGSPPRNDESSLEEVLSAANAVQEQQDLSAAKNLKQSGHAEPVLEPAQVLAEIVEIQNLLHNQPGDLQTAIDLIAERIQKVTHAAGVAIGFVEEKQIVYRACLGKTAEETGAIVPLERSLSGDCVRGRQVVRSSDAEDDTRFPVGICRRKNIKSLLAVPVYHEGKIAGVIELCFAAIRSFPEPEIRACQLMAGLVTDTLFRAAEAEWKQTLASERTAMLQAIQKIKPQLERLAVQPSPSESAATPVKEIVSAAPGISDPQPFVAELLRNFAGLEQRQAEPDPHLSASPDDIFAEDGKVCQHCAHQLREDESFCGLCGTACKTEQPASAAESSKGESNKNDPGKIESGPVGIPSSSAPSPQLEALLREFESHSPEPFSTSLQPSALKEIAEELIEKKVPVPKENSVLETKDELIIKSKPIIEAKTETPPGKEESLLLVPPDDASSSTGSVPEQPPWFSAKDTRQWLESLATEKPRKTWLARHRAGIYVSLAAVLLILVLTGWGIRPQANRAPANAASLRRQTPPRPKLTLAERALVSLGLAEPPPAPVYLGNPNTHVWVDVHTALYYCPGADLFGKTPDGKLATQRDAQEDQFEPAFRKACD